MKLLVRTTWRYAILFILLFAIAALAAYVTIEGLGQYDISESAKQQMSLAIWLLTLGFMSMSGAMGLLVIRFSVESESRRRIGRFVDSMDYLSDGVVMLQGDGRIAASNPAARELAQGSVAADGPASLREAFPCLGGEDEGMLLDERQTREIEREIVSPEGVKILRFRSQHSAGVRLVLIGDVTERKKRDIWERQMAQLQLVGRIAAGVAHDFNNILCAISGYASLMKRQPRGALDLQDSVNVILAETDRGSRLSRQLLELSRSGASGGSRKLEDNVSEAAELLRVALSSKWSVRSNLEAGLPAVPLSPAQVEQVVLNLGLLSADEQPRPGNVTISLGKPGAGHLLDVGSRFAAVILVSARADPEAEESPSGIAVPVQDARADAGVIQSVVHSIVKEAGGRLDYMIGQDGLCIYRVCLPHLDAGGGGEALPLRRERLREHLSGWSVLLAAAPRHGDALARAFRLMGIAVEQKPDIISLLAAVDKGRIFEGIVLHEELLGTEREGLLRALVRLNAGAGLLVLCRDAESSASGAGPDVLFESELADPETIALRLVEARIRVSDRALPARA